MASAAGRPLLVVPVGGEQHDNAQRVTWLGAGLWISLSELSAERVRAAVARLRNEPGFSQRAAEFAGILASCDGARTGAGLIERRGRERRPLRFEGEMPLALDCVVSPGESVAGESDRRAS